MPTLLPLVDVYRFRRVWEGVVVVVAVEIKKGLLKPRKKGWKEQLREVKLELHLCNIMSAVKTGAKTL